MEITVHELTQGQAEAIIDALPEDKISAVKYQGIFVQAAVESGWVETSEPLILRADVRKTYEKISSLWVEANKEDGPTAAG